MTRAEWDALTPRERDATVAEKVMGWEKRAMFVAEHNYGRDLPDHGDMVWADPGERKAYHHRVEDHVAWGDGDEDDQGFAPTTSWDAMHEVVEKTKDWRITMEGGEYHGDRWEVKIVTNDGCFFADATTLPEAVSIAALTTLGHIA